MPRALGTLEVARETVQYYQNILDSPGLIAYWMLDERYGTVVYDQTTMGQLGVRNGAHTGVTLAQPGIGDGRTSPFYDGVNDYTNVFSASLQGILNGGKGTMMTWARVANAGVWTDGTTRYVFRFAVDGNNYISIYRVGGTNNRLRYEYRAGGVFSIVNVDGLSTVDWMGLVITWSAVGNQMIAYIDGVQQGVPQAVGVFAGNLASAIIGALTAVPASPWHGYIAHVGLWNRALTPVEVLALSVV